MDRVRDRAADRFRGRADVEGVGDGVEVSRAAEPGGRHAVRDGAEHRRAQGLAGLAAEEDRGRGGAAFASRG